jgi:hypothetical protein
VAATAGQVTDLFRALLPAGRADVDDVVRAELPRQRETLGHPVEHHDRARPALARDRGGVEAEAAGALDDDGVAGLKPGLVVAVDHLRERAVERRDDEIGQRVLLPEALLCCREFLDRS